jgi:pimeloyl-ACP methyl ester carboxylesterase
MRKFLAGTLILLALLLISGCGAFPPSRAVNIPRAAEETNQQRQNPPGRGYRFRWVKCEYGNLPVEIDCGYLNVPVDRTDPRSPRIRLAVTILRARGGGMSAAPDPVLILSGQPGSAATFDIREWLESPLLDERDIILMDLRGTGKSQPNLNCPEFEEGNPGDVKALQACRKRLEREHIVLDQYTSAQSAADLNDLRQALGYESWNVLGISYGTRVALTLLRDFPEGIRSVVLDSVYPLEVNIFEEQAVNAAQAIQAFFTACHQDAQCAFTYPDLEQVFGDLLISLDKNPRPVMVADPRTGEIQMVALDGNRMASLIMEALNTPETLARIPYLIYETQYGNDHAIAGLMFPSSYNGAALTPEQAKEIRRAFAEGAYYSLICAEEAAFNDLKAAESAARESGSPLAERFYSEVRTLFERCQAWNVKAAESIETQAIASPVPALLLSGEYDPLTPPHWAQIAAHGLPDSKMLVFPATGHHVLNLGACPQGIVAEFIANPVAPIDDSCINDLQVEYWLP